MVERYRAKQEPVGWLVWYRVNGRDCAFKAACAAYPSSFPDTAKKQAEVELQRYPITDVEWDTCSIDQLKVKYPLMVKKEVADAPK